MSLHGLVVADAYGVANTWLAPSGQSRLKYLDYAAAVGRDMAAPVALADIPSLIGLQPGPGAPLPYSSGIDRCRDALRASFPTRFQAVAQTEAAS